ncbi:MAG: hypothetical protein QGH07_12470 [Alphaproteobacteria bacterium]|nr:hypothetical protein [Alphaproteobacteria bacterium]
MMTAGIGCFSTQRLAGKMPMRGQMLFVFMRIFEGQPCNITAAITHDAGANQSKPKSGSAAPPCSTVTTEILDNTSRGISDRYLAERAIGHLGA